MENYKKYPVTDEECEAMYKDKIEKLKKGKLNCCICKEILVENVDYISRFFIDDVCDKCSDESLNNPDNY